LARVKMLTNIILNSQEISFWPDPCFSVVNLFDADSRMTPMNPKPRSALSTISAVLCLCLFMAPAANGGLYEEPGTLIRLLTRTDENNDSLRQLESEVDALLEEVPAARTLDDPMLTLGINALPTDTFSFSQEPMTQKQIFIAQRIPWFGKLDLRSRKV